MAVPPEPWRPSARYPHLEWWVPLFVSCAAVQRANCVSGPFLSPLDVSGGRAWVRAHWAEGSEAALEPASDITPEELWNDLRVTAPGAETAPSLPGHDRQFWAPEQDDPEPLRYAWLLDQLSIDSTHWRMKELRLIRVELVYGSGMADVMLRAGAGSETVVARVPLLSGQELVGAPDWIAGQVISALERGAGRELSGPQAGVLVELPS